MFTIPNFISFTRIPLALFFFQENASLRSLALLLAMLSDYLDGYISRRFHMKSHFGTILDPISDKFFVFTVLAVMISEQRLTYMEALMLISRDFSVMLFGVYLFFTKKLAHYQFRSIWCGKISTTLQFLVLLGMTNGIAFPPYTFSLFIFLGLMALFELYFFKHKSFRSSRVKKS